MRPSTARLAARAIEVYGGFDTWVNDAGLGLFGRIADVPDEDHRQVFEVNYWGLVYGSKAAVAHLRTKGGALINLGSVASDVAFPIQGMYAASKHAIKGFTDAFRMEIEEAGEPVSVTLIKPAAINTPFAEHARSHIDREPKLPPPLYLPEDVAMAILHAAVHGGRDYYIGGGGKLMSSLNKRFPALMDRLGSTRMAVRAQMEGEPIRRPEGSLYEAAQDGHVNGDSPHMVRSSLYTRATLNPLATGLLLAAAGVASAAFLSAERGRPRPRRRR